MKSDRGIGLGGISISQREQDLRSRRRVQGLLLTPEGNTTALKEGGDLSSCESSKDLKNVEQGTVEGNIGAGEDLLQ